MILKFRHKGLKRFFEHGDHRGINSMLADNIQVVLAVLDEAAGIEEIGSIHGFRLHPLKGDRAGQWSVTVSGNWRIVFEMDGEHVTNVDLVDYH